MAKVTDRTMYLYHVTPIVNWFPVGVHGLRVDYSKSETKSIFLVSLERLDWAIQHVEQRSGFPREKLMVVTVRVRRSKMTPVRFRGAKRGLWRHNGNIGVNRIEAIDPVSSAYNSCVLPFEAFEHLEEREGFDGDW